MYPYDEEKNENVEENPAGSDGSYRMTRPDAGKSFDARQEPEPGAGTGTPAGDPCYRDANYTRESGSAGAGRRASCRVAALPLGVSYAPPPAAVTLRRAGDIT